MRTPGWCVLALVSACSPSSGEGPIRDHAGTESSGIGDASGDPGETSSGIVDASSDDASTATSSTGEPPAAQPSRLRDESGALFDWVCGADPDRPDHCSIERIPDVSPPLPDCGQREAFYSYAWSINFRIAGACDLGETPGWSTRDDWERCVVCSEDSECPPVVDSDDFFECRDGYCQNVDPEPYADLPPQPCDNTAPRYGCEDPSCSSGIPE
jgi:hypothetical protein